VGIDIQNKIIIFDEAHNIENMAEDCCSKELKI
jgi:Rad3-related DNA helicase